MMRQYELVERVTRYNPNANEDLLNKAYVYGMTKHGNQQRASGDPYFSHPLEVAAILTNMKLDDATIAVGLLHDTIEDTSATRTEIDKLFGSEIGGLVEGLTKIKRLDLITKEAAQAENLRKLLLAISDDVRVLLVKLADRLHNMRTLDHVPPGKRLRIAEETMDIYAPLAGRMGMRGVREELEDLAFKHINLDAYNTINNRLAELRERNKDNIELVHKELVTRLEQAGINASVKGREKAPFSIFRKMERKAIGFEQLSDVYGFRIIVDNVEDCYQVLGLVHTKWSVVPGRFKDFISTPKQNDYRSIHTTIIGPGRQRVELQIRTQEMHEINEYGVAAHSAYKEKSDAESATNDGGKNGFCRDSYAYSWLQNTVQALTEASEHGDIPNVDLLENTKLELFQDQVFCFTPKGRLVSLPRGANSIDFAYAVHTDIGDTCIGTKINGQIMPLVTELQNGDEVEILRSAAQKPLAVWENLVVTGKARAAIRRSTRAEVKRQYAELGRQILARHFETAEKPYNEEEFAKILPSFGLNDLEEGFARLGRGELSPSLILEGMFPDIKPSTSMDKLARAQPGEGWFGIGSKAMKFRIPGIAKRVVKKEGPAVPIRGLDSDLPVKFSAEGGAVPGDRIVGILEPGIGVTIYPIQSESLSSFEDLPELWLDVRWDISGSPEELFSARIVVSALHEPGTLARVAQIIGDHNSNIERIELKHGASDFTDMVIDLRVSDIKNLNMIMAKIRESSVTSTVYRVYG